jgi:hypothetical protein
MNSRMDEDLAWLRVQDMQREVENRRLMADAAASGTPGKAKLGLRVVQALKRFIWRKDRSERVTPPAMESRHHA